MSTLSSERPVSVVRQGLGLLLMVAAALCALASVTAVHAAR